MTAQVPLTRGLFAIVDLDDAPLLLKHRWIAAPAFSKSGAQLGWYARRSEGRKNIYMHRSILSPPKGFLVDHVNGDRLDNRRINLRLANNSQNVVNRPQAPGAVRFRGVHQDGRFVVRVIFEGRVHRIGRFDDAVSAARAYDEAARRIHGEFAVLNFPEEARKAA